MSIDPPEVRDRRTGAILGYGLLGGFVSSSSCCCAPVSFLIALAATRRAGSKGLLRSGSEGLVFGAGLGVVMGLVMASFGTAFQLRNLSPEQFAEFSQQVPEASMGLFAVALIVMNGTSGFLAGLLAGALGRPKQPRSHPGQPMSAAMAQPLAVPGAAAH